jgi:glycosyltransferase involved in cell wall biosynthesis
MPAASGSATPVHTPKGQDGRRVALIAGGLSQGGAEKQFVYMARALQQRGVEVRCYCLTQGDFYEEALGSLNLPPVWVGQFGAPPLRLLRLARLLRAFRPQVVQAGHFFANLYAGIGARACGALSVGAIRNDGAFELRENKGWGPLLLRLPDIVIANSHAGARHAQAHGRRAEDVVVVPNVIDLDAFDAVQTDVDLRAGHTGSVAIAVGRLVGAKRFDRFLAALAIARRQVPHLHGVIVGEGPERESLEREARRLGLEAPVLRFIGRRADVPALLRQADVLVSSSDHEGFPNVLLEAMAARLPIVTTPAGDAASVVLADVTGYVVPADDIEGLSGRLVLLAASSALREQVGRAGRARVEAMYRDDSLADRLLTVYRDAAGRRGRRSEGFWRVAREAETAPDKTSPIGRAAR